MIKSKAKPGTDGFKEETKQASTPTADTVLVEIPMGTLPVSPTSQTIHRPLLHIDAQLNREQSTSLRRMLVGLRASGATCSTAVGRRRLVDSNQDVIRWLLEQVVGE